MWKFLGNDHDTVFMDVSFFTESCNFRVRKIPNKSKSSEKE